jgi:hypothetical protein
VFRPDWQKARRNFCVFVIFKKQKINKSLKMLLLKHVFLSTVLVIAIFASGKFSEI